TDLAGWIHLVDGPSWDRLAISRAVRLGRGALGIDRGPDGQLYVCVSQVDLRGWRSVGGAVLRVDPELTSWTPVTESYPAINGLAFDGSGTAYFASSPFHPLRPQGGVYRMRVTDDGDVSVPELLLEGMGMTNGVRYSSAHGQIYFTETVVGAFAFSPHEDGYRSVYRKSRLVEGFDDLAIDSEGRLWMADPGRSTVKRFDPGTRQLTRFRIDGVGQVSACGLRLEGGRAILYLTEIHRSRNPLLGRHDGRGLVVLPVDGLEAAAGGS
ncbi:MAG: SMP-30/gluconolactonase/LRE family protein, partial [Candidatus Bipolaricaulota bacterium]